MGRSRGSTELAVTTRFAPAVTGLTALATSVSAAVFFRELFGVF